MSLRSEDVRVNEPAVRPPAGSSTEPQLSTPVGDASRAPRSGETRIGTKGALAFNGSPQAHAAHPDVREQPYGLTGQGESVMTGEQSTIASEQTAPAEVDLVSANTVEFDESGLADASISGDTEAFEALYTHYFPRVRGFCLRKLGNRETAEDIAQEAFARAFERITDFGGPRHFGGWVGTIAANLCTDHLRRKKNMPVPLEDNESSAPAYEMDPIRNIQRQDTGRLVRLALDKLEPRHREALLMHEVKGMSCAAVGERLGISEVAAESLLARARRRLRREITAKAAPADLFGLGGLGLLPALVRAWRRARHAAGRRVTAAHAYATRGWDGVAGNLVPTLDAAKALMVVVGAALVVEAATGAIHTTTVRPSTLAASSFAPIAVDGDLLGVRGARTAGGSLGNGFSAALDPASRSLDVKAGIDRRGQAAPGSQIAPFLYANFHLQSGEQEGTTSLDARIAVGPDDGSTVADTGAVHQELQDPA